MPRPECFVLRSGWRQSIWQCTTSKEAESRSVVLIHQLKETKSAKCGLQGICSCVRFPWGECHMCLLWSKKVIWPAPEAPSSTETHRNTLIFWELPQIWITVGRFYCSLVCELTGKGSLSFCNFGAMWQCFFSLQWRSVSLFTCKQFREGQFFLMKWVKWVLVKVVYTDPTATNSMGWSQGATAWLL